MPKLVVVNQVVGPFYLSLLKEIVSLKNFEDILLITGTFDTKIIEELEGFNIKVKLCTTYNNKKPIYRLLTWLAFSVQVTICILNERYLKKNLNTKWLFSSNPPILSPILSILNLHRNIDYYYYILDVYPEVLISSKILKSDSYLYRVWKFFDIQFVKNSLKLLTLDIGMQAKLVSLYPGLVEGKSIDVIPLGLGINKRVKVARHDNFIAKNLGYIESDLVVGYAGNMGVGHDFSFLKKLNLKQKKLKFIFIGGGNKYPVLKNEFKRNDSFQFRPYFPHQDLSCVISLPDISIITIEEKADTLMIPSKFYSCVEFGLPIFFIGPKNHYLANIINEYNLGFAVENGDIKKMNQILSELDKNNLSKGYEKNFDAFISSLNQVKLEKIL